MRNIVKQKQSKKLKKALVAARRQRTALYRFYQTVCFTLVLAILFGYSAIGKAADEVKKFVKTRKPSTKKSRSHYRILGSWKHFQPMWGDFLDIPEPIARRENIVSDPDNLIEDEFEPSSELKDRVSFWVDIYSRFSSEWRVVHDRMNPNIIYGYIDLRPIYRAYNGSRKGHAKARQMEQEIIKELKARFYEAIGTPVDNKKRLTAQEKATLQNFFFQNGATDLLEMRRMIGHIRAQTGQADFFLKGIQRSKKVLPQIEKIFSDAGLPKALTRLPFVESSFNPRALSKVGATGMWQFTADTAKVFLPKGNYTQWSEPMNQSRWAAKMFVSFRKKTDDWSLAVTSYNSGINKLLRLQQKYDAKSMDDLIKVRSNEGGLGFAGKNFWTELVAANLVEAYKEKVFSQRALKYPHLFSSRKIQSIPTQSLLFFIKD